MRAIALILGLLPTPAVAADQFDLVCTGKQREERGIGTFPVQHRYRIDLAAKKWCVDTCPQIDAIASADDNVIYLVNDEEKFRGDAWEIDRVYRSNGLWAHLRSNGVTPLEIQGKCEPASFSGFPEVTRKF